jgi:hypothetical protein
MVVPSAKICSCDSVSVAANGIPFTGPLAVKFDRTEATATMERSGVCISDIGAEAEQGPPILPAFDICERGDWAPMDTLASVASMVNEAMRIKTPYILASKVYSSTRKINSTISFISGLHAFQSLSSPSSHPDQSRSASRL